MRPKFVIFILAVVLAILAIVFWWRPVQSPPIAKQAEQQPENPNTLATNVSNLQQGASNAALVAIPSGTNPMMIESPLHKQLHTPEGFKQYVEDHNKPIEFYGKVIDQDGNALAGAKVKIGIRHWTMPDPAILLAGSKDIDLEQTSDANGRFEFHGATGDGFGMGITKDGYELEQNKYGSGPTAGSFDDPVIFKMWSTNIHEKLIGGERSFHIVPDRRPYFINLTDGTISESGTGDLKVWIKRPEQVSLGQKYDWACEVDVINGGLLEQPRGSTMYSAPTEGYVPSFQFEQTVGSGWGDTTGERRFYVTLKNGRECGRISIELYANYNGQIPAMIRLSYAINPSGSRILR